MTFPFGMTASPLRLPRTDEAGLSIGGSGRPLFSPFYSQPDSPSACRWKESGCFLWVCPDLSAPDGEEIGVLPRALYLLFRRTRDLPIREQRARCV